MNFAIFSYGGKAENKGGPVGYLYHLYCGFNSDAPDLLFINDAGNKHETSEKEKITEKSCPFLLELKSILSYFKHGMIVAKKYRGKLKDYRLIHVHESPSVYYLRFFCGYKGKIVLTSHRPEPLADEVINATRVKSPGRYRFLNVFLNYIERYSYKHSDGFLFPSPGAAGIYEVFPGFSKYKEGKPIKFITTGLNYKAPTADRQQYFKLHQLEIDPQKKIVTYIGRHNHIKGYDRVIAAFPTIQELGGVVLVAGAESDIQYPTDPDWIELGYINDAMNLMSISDVVVIPNRNTYFDLVIIEALSLGKIVVTSNTGGNVDIAKTNEGLYLFENDKENGCSEAIRNILQKSEAQRKKMEESSRDYYLNNCTPKVFADNYLNMIQEFCKYYDNKESI